MTLYTGLNLGILLFPFLLSFDRKVAFWRRWPRVLVSVLVVGSVFIGWDVAVTKEGHWSFDPELAGGGRLFGLPLGEYLFFAVVPYACLFILEVVRAYVPEREWRLPRLVPLALALACAAPLPFVADRGYTLIVLSVGLLVCLLVAFPGLSLFRRRSTLLALAVSYLPFLVFNGVFTGIPIVSYAPDMILGPRVGSIPVEDFLYSASMLAANFLVYEWSASFGRKRK